MYRTLSALVALAMTAGAFALAAPARAAPAEDTVTIGLSDLNPGDPADAGRIERRIRRAARDFCGSTLVQPVGLKARAAACEKAMVAEGQEAVEVAAAKRSGPFRLSLRSN